MKNQLSILVLIFSFLVSSCSNNIESNQSKSKALAKDQEVKNQESNQLKSKYVVTGEEVEEAAKNVVKIQWSYCGGPEKILSAEEDGCVRNKDTLYFWLKDPEVKPKGVLIKRGLPISSSFVQYKVAILAQGCFPSKTKDQPLDFYSVPGYFSVNSEIVGDRKILEDVVLDVQPLSENEAYKVLAYYKVRPNLSAIGCDFLEEERDILAPYSPKPLGSMSNE